MKKFFLLVICIGVLVPLIWLVSYKFEGTPPQVAADLPAVYLKDGFELSLEIRDAKTGLRRVEVSIHQRENEKVLLEKSYPPISVFTLVSEEKQLEDRFVVPVESRRYGMNDGEAILRIQVSDQSWRGWGRGNVAHVERTVIIDTQPPQVQVLSQQHN
ncbi:MAG: M23 family peptidase, partial [Desulfotignum sp.]